MFEKELDVASIKTGWNEVLLDELQVTEPATITPICTPIEYKIYVDNVEYSIKTGEIININVDNKTGYTFIGFTNGLQNGKKYHKDLGSEFSSIYEANEYERRFYPHKYGGSPCRARRNFRPNGYGSKLSR